MIPCLFDHDELRDYPVTLAYNSWPLHNMMQEKIFFVVDWLSPVTVRIYHFTRGRSFPCWTMAVMHVCAFSWTTPTTRSIRRPDSYIYQTKFREKRRQGMFEGYEEKLSSYSPDGRSTLQVAHIAPDLHPFCGWRKHSLRQSFPRTFLWQPYSLQTYNNEWRERYGVLERRCGLCKQPSSNPFNRALNNYQPTPLINHITKAADDGDPWI